MMDPGSSTDLKGIGSREDRERPRIVGKLSCCFDAVPVVSVRMAYVVGVADTRCQQA
jgi:hypothetical protein